MSTSIVITNDVLQIEGVESTVEFIFELDAAGEIVVRSNPDQGQAANAAALDIGYRRGICGCLLDLRRAFDSSSTYEP